MIKLLSKNDFDKGQVEPFIINKEGKKIKEGNFSIYFFSRTVMDREGNRYVKKYRYCPLRFEGELARFKKRKDAIAYARHRLALDD